MTLNTEFMLETYFIALKGIPVTLSLAAISLLLASPAAFFMAIARINRIKGLQKAVTVYVSFVRGTPMILQILVIYSLLPSLLNQLFMNLNLKINVFDVNPILYAYIVFTLNTAAALSEVFRSALQTVSIGQLEAAQSIGLSTYKAYTRIVIPQALVVALPNLGNVTVNLIKGTSLAFMMTVKDITALAKIEASYGYNYIEAYIVIFFIYIILCSGVQLAFRLLEKYLGGYRKPAAG